MVLVCFDLIDLSNYVTHMYMDLQYANKWKSILLADSVANEHKYPVSEISTSWYSLFVICITNSKN